MGCGPAWQRSYVGEGVSVAKLAPARRAALALVSERRRRGGRIRDIARESEALAALSTADRALAFRLALGATAAAPVVQGLVDKYLKRPSSLEPRVRDALQIAAYELCYLDTPAAVAASQGVELVRSVAPRAAGLANAVMRKIAHEDRPHVDAARTRAAQGCADAAELSLMAGLPLWLVQRVADERGIAFATSFCLAQTEPAPVFVAANSLHNTADELQHRLQEFGMAPQPIAGLPGSFMLGDAAPLAASGLVDSVNLAVADLSAQLVCRVAAPAGPCALLEVGQGRGTKSVLLATALGAVHPACIHGVDSVAYKVAVSERRMQAAGLSEVVRCYQLDACVLDSNDLPTELCGQFGAVLLDAPCSGTGTLRRHPEISSELKPTDVTELAALQLRMLTAASARVAPGGVLTYATCSVLYEEDEAVVQAFLASEAGASFHVQPVEEAPACKTSPALAHLVIERQTIEGYLLSTPIVGGGDGHFCARLVREA